MKTNKVLELSGKLIYSIPGIVVDFEDGQKRIKTADTLNVLSWLEEVQDDWPKNIVRQITRLKKFIVKHKQESYVVA